MTLPKAFPADLVAAYRQVARSREQGWRGPPSEASWDYLMASRAIRMHPFWRTLPDPAAVAEAGRRLREISVLPEEDGGRRVVPYLPLELDDDAQASRRSERFGQAARAQYAARLDAAGMWDRFPEDVRVRERQHAEDTGDDLRHGLDYRDRQFWADGEELFERGADHLFDVLAPSLAECGLALDVVTLSDPYHAPPSSGAEEYILEINGMHCPVWTVEDDLERGNGWHLSTVRPLIVINELLEAVGARERVYAEFGAECIFLLPMEVREILVDSDLGRWSSSSLELPGA